MKCTVAFINYTTHKNAIMSHYNRDSLSSSLFVLARTTQYSYLYTNRHCCNAIYVSIHIIKS